MDTPDLESRIDERMRILTIICAALVGSVVIYGAVGWFLLTQGGIAPGGILSEVPIVPYILAALGLGALIFAPIVTSLMLKQGGNQPDPGNPEPALMRYQSSVIVGFAVRESAAVMGLVATILTGSVIWIVALSTATVAAMLMAWPRRENLVALFRSGPGTIG